MWWLSQSKYGSISLAKPRCLAVQREAGSVRVNMSIAAKAQRPDSRRSFRRRASGHARLAVDRVRSTPRAGRQRAAPIGLEKSFFRRALFVAACSVVLTALAWTAPAQPVVLPVEVVGADGTTVTVTVELAPDLAARVQSLWMQIHGLAYGGMVSVQVNDGAWHPLRNDTVTVAEPGQSYGGIGGGFATLSVTLPLPPGSVAPQTNALRFRFNQTDGIASGFRALAFNFMTGEGRPALPAETFVFDDPNSWTPPLPGAENISAGEQLWRNAPIVASGLPNAAPIHAHCADCHARDGRDLKYFNYSNASIIARAQFHGLPARQDRQIASYIRTLPEPNPGRPWNPPYQPGPGLDAQPVANWSAGAGLRWALADDTESLAYAFAQADGTVHNFTPAATLASHAPKITPATFRPDGNLNAREIPISLQLPDWNHWLPRVHPLDAWGPDFPRGGLAALYDGAYDPASAARPQPLPASARNNLRARLASPERARLIATGEIATLFDQWTAAGHLFLEQQLKRQAYRWSPSLSEKTYATQLWLLVKAWELAQEFALEGRGPEHSGVTGEPRAWFNVIPAAAAPATFHIPDGPNGMGGSGLSNEYFDNSWYELQLLLNNGGHRHHDQRPIDWVYLISRFLDLNRESHRPEPGRLLIAVIKAWQSTDPALGPNDYSHGWRPNRNIDPRIIVSRAWEPVFQPLPPETRKAITESMLAAWLDKNLQYPEARYFAVGLTERPYAPPADYGAISGGKVWEAAPQFQAAGVSPALIARLREWGRAYSDMAARFHY